MSSANHDEEATPYQTTRVDDGVSILRWTKGVPVEEKALEQLENLARMPFVFRHIAAMPDVHVGIGATVGSVVATHKAIIPAAVGVDIGCGMMAVRTSLLAKHLPDDLKPLRNNIERSVPHGRTNDGGPNDRGAWSDAPGAIDETWRALAPGFAQITEKYPRLQRANTRKHLGTLGTGNHFIEVCLDEEQRVWVMLHSGSRGVGNAIGSLFIELAKEDMRRLDKKLPDADLAYLSEGAALFDDYVHAVGWAQDFAKRNREIMMARVLEALRTTKKMKPFTTDEIAVNCHHNYVQKERHFGEDVFVTRKGAVSAQQGQLGIIPGSMGAKSFIVRGKGNPQSFSSCSHGAGRKMSRTEAKKRFTLADHERDTKDVECRKDAAVIDETPRAYKDIDQVMAAQSDLVEIVHTLKQVVCVKG